MTNSEIEHIVDTKVKELNDLLNEAAKCGVFLDVEVSRMKFSKEDTERVKVYKTSEILLKRIGDVWQYHDGKVAALLHQDRNGLWTVQALNVEELENNSDYGKRILFSKNNPTFNSVFKALLGYLADVTP